MMRRLAQVDQSYATGAPVASHLRVGDRFGDLPFYDGFHDRDRRAYELLAPTRHTVVLTNPTADPAETASLATLADTLRTRFGDLVHCVLVSPHFEALVDLDAFDDHALDRQRHFGQLYGRRSSVHVVRPDMYFSGVALAAEDEVVRGVLDTTVRAARQEVPA